MEQRTQYTIAEKIRYFRERIKRDQYKLAALEQLVATGVSPDTYTSQEWNGQLKRQLDLIEMRKLVREELELELKNKKPETA